MFSFNDVMCFCILVIYSQKPGFLAFESSRGQKWLSAIIQRQLNSKASVNSGFGPSGDFRGCKQKPGAWMLLLASTGLRPEMLLNMYSSLNS